MKEQICDPNSDLYIELDARGIYPVDPGRGAPAIVYAGAYEAKYCATFQYAQNEGSLIGNSGFYHLTDDQLSWLDKQENLVNDFIEAHS